MEKSIKGHDFSRAEHLVVASLILLSTIAVALDPAAADESIKVGVFQNKPIVYYEDGAKGLFVEILNHAAEKENWEIDYVPCEFKDCLELLKSNELDLMTSLGESPERKKHFVYSRESIWTFWGTIYSNDPELNSVLDLEGKKIAVRRKNKITSGLKKLLTDFNISVEYVEFDNYETSFESLGKKNVDAAAVNNTYAFSKQRTHALFHRTPIVFDPFSAYFAVSRDKGDFELLEKIDRHVRALREDPSSIFHDFQKKWFGFSESYWTGKRIGAVSAVLLFITISWMAAWRYRSLLKVNKKLRDSIAVRRQVEKALVDKNRELENYIYIASHDLRSPLVNIQGFSRRLQKHMDAVKKALSSRPPGDATKQDVDDIMNDGIPKALGFIFANVSKMDTLINGLLRISRTGRVKMVVEPIDMNKLMERIVQSLSFQMEEASARIFVEKLPVCHGDAALLNQLFSNIIGNALKYRDQHRPLTIEVDAKSENDKVIYSVKDTGIGISGRHLEKIWDVFYQVDPRAEKAGDGIGLSIVKRIVDKHRGAITVESEEGEGSVFYIELNKNEFSE